MLVDLNASFKMKRSFFPSSFTSIESFIVLQRIYILSNRFMYMVLDSSKGFNKSRTECMKSITSRCSDGTELDFFDTLPDNKVVYFHRYEESSSSQIKE